MKNLKYIFFCIKWLCKNRTWDNTKQKFRQMERDYAWSICIQQMRKGCKNRPKQRFSLKPYILKIENLVSTLFKRSCK
jgi:hypothetical protein